MKRKNLLASILVFILFMTPSICFSNEIKLMFPSFEGKKKTTAQGIPYIFYAVKKGEEGQEYVETTLLQFIQEFEKEKYKVEQIELWIEGRAESGGVTKLFVSLEGKGGCKVILRPRK